MIFFPYLYIYAVATRTQVSLAKGLGVKVATILEDPVVKEADMHIYTTHTKHFPVRGSGFVSVQDPGKAPVVVIDGISSANFKIQVTETLVFIVLYCQT